MVSCRDYNNSEDFDTSIYKRYILFKIVGQMKPQQNSSFKKVEKAPAAR